jgi:GT2 family glycosyltransferase/glycosyltransferase involved in cell wall biosynthesis/SAM-dependent methyltransferase
MSSGVNYWRKGAAVQNFGDFLSELLLAELFLPEPDTGREIRIIGSCIDDGLVATAKIATEFTNLKSHIFWGCGLRREDGLGESARDVSEFLTVRGPLSRSFLRLGDDVPVGDPGLLLPALHQVREEKKSNDTLLVPHFLDTRSDEELRQLSGCSRVLRPNIPNRMTAITDFIDELVGSEFVLCGSLHAAITAAAYGKPFAFWNSGNIDIPFKWRDFAASLSIPCEFHERIESARIHYASEIAPRLQMPVLWPLLVAAPMAIRPDAFAKVARLDVSRHGPSALHARAQSQFSEVLHAQMSQLALEIDELRSEKTERQAAFAAQLELERDKMLAQGASIEDLNRRLVQFSAEDEKKRQALRDLRADYNAIINSTTWRATTLIRRIGAQNPGAAQLFKRVARKAWRKVSSGSAVAPTYIQPERQKSAAVDLREAFLAWHGAGPIHFPPMQSPKVSVIIPVYRGLQDLQACLRSLTANRETEPAFEVILVDDCPTEQTLWAIPTSGGLRKISNSENLGFLLSCNRGAAAARGEYLCFLNSDTIVSPGWLKHLVEAIEEEPNTGLAGGMLLNNDGTIQDGGWRILSNGWGHPIGRNESAQDGAFTYRRRVDCITGACFVTPKRIFDKLGGFDRAYAPAYYEEFDYAFRLRRQQLQAVYEPRSRVLHLGSMSYGSAQRDKFSQEHHAIFVERYADILPKQPWDISDKFAIRQTLDAGPTILVVDIDLPQPNRHAGDVTLSSYLKLLAVAGLRVVFAAMRGPYDGPDAEALERLGIEIVRAPRSIEEWLDENGKHVSHVWLARPEIAERLIEVVRSRTSAPIAYYTHDLHHLRLRREADLRGDGALLKEADRVRDQEAAIFRRVDHVMSPSSEEVDAIKSLAPDVPVSVLPPYFFEAEEIQTRSVEHFAARSDVLFVGGFPHTPNVDAAMFMAQEVMPLVWKEEPEARLVLVGYGPPPEVEDLACERIVVTGQVPSLEPSMENARVVLAALRYGAGVKGKVVEALRFGIPVVTTPVGAEGIGIRPGHDAIVATTADDLAQGVLTLLRSAERCAEMSAAGADLVKRKFSRAAANSIQQRIFNTPRCGVCGSAHVLDVSEEKNRRESFVCKNCYSLARTEALGRVLRDRLAGSGEASLAEVAERGFSQSIHEFGFVGSIVEALHGQPRFTTSDYFDDVPKGTFGPLGVRCEDLTQLTFEDSSFDVVISQDVLEHVPDPRKAFSEIARVLKPGGSHVFTIPYSPLLGTSVTRAYHGDPVRAEGALVFTDFGADLSAMLEDAGLRLIQHEVPLLGGLSTDVVLVFEAINSGP